MEQFDEAQHRGTFGGLWTDRTDALPELERRLRDGRVDGPRAGLLRRFIEDGFVVLEGAIPAATCDRLRKEQTRILRRGSSAHLWHGPGASPIALVPRGADGPTSRIPDIHGPTPCALDVLLADPIVDFLEVLFEEAPLLFQSLAFARGSRQPLHQDTAYVVVDPPMALAAAWVALEDIRPGSGELTYAVGSHRLPESLFSGAYKHWNPARDGEQQHREWLADLPGRVAQHGMPIERFSARKGDVLVWAADLVHGGGPVDDDRLTRRSVVGHYCPTSATPHYFGIVPDRVKRPHGRAFVSSIYYDLSTRYPCDEPMLVGGLRPELPNPSATPSTTGDPRRGVESSGGPRRWFRTLRDRA